MSDAKEMCEEDQIPVNSDLMPPRPLTQITPETDKVGVKIRIPIINDSFFDGRAQLECSLFVKPQGFNGAGHRLTLPPPGHHPIITKSSQPTEITLLADDFWRAVIDFRLGGFVMGPAYLYYYLPLPNCFSMMWPVELDFPLSSE
ncbi:hypothetical protein LJR230_001505 [Trinickia sp. LjRoot230]|uniref:hypothetical protein n=1 Tax=Trinickia sp. LjRoot230 TaxID=3342288 RepID=UPI003ED11A81